MFWGGIAYDACTEIVCLPRPALNARRYVLEVLAERVVPFAPFIGADFLLLYDNALPQVALDVIQYLHDVGITTLKWPPHEYNRTCLRHVKKVYSAKKFSSPNIS
nr:unnamed protein product [Callosobruchus analis]